MGFQGRVLQLRWPVGHPLHGMEVDISPISVGALNEYRAGIREDETKEQWQRRRLEITAEHVHSWNLEYPRGERRGRPLPITADGLLAFENEIVVELIEAWHDNARIPVPSTDERPDGGEDREPIDPLAGGSGSGSPTPESLAVEELIPTQVLR